MTASSRLTATISAFTRTAVVLLLLWQSAIWLSEPPRFILPSPGDVAEAFMRQPAFLARHSLITLTEIMAGLLLGMTFGAFSAVAIAAFPRLGRLVWPVLLVFQAFPVFVIAPLLVVWFGFGMTSKIVMATVIIFFPITSAFADGIRRTEPAMLDAAALTTATHWQTLYLVRLPLALPSLLSGIRVAAPLAPLGAVIGEWVGSSAGLGFVMVQANARMQTDLVFAAMAILAAMSLGLRHLVDRLGPRLIPWARDQ